MLRKLIVLIVLCSLLLSVATPSPNVGQAQENAQIFPQTGKTVSGRFLEYWRTHGGLEQQGYPISDMLSEQSEVDGKIYTVQYFERAVFEAHPENAAPNDVLLSLLGSLLYNRKYPKGASDQVQNSLPGSQLFPVTGKRVGGPFLSYWTSHGSLAQQGYPISEEFIETSELDGKPYKVQYFERAVFEYHPENAGTRFEVLLSQLGTFKWQAKQIQPTATRVVPTPSILPSPTTPTQPPPPTTPAGPNADELSRGAARVFGPVNGVLLHNNDDAFVPERLSGVILRNFVVEARFYNPYDKARNPWSYGFTFRRKASSSGVYSQYRTGVHSNGAWFLRLGLGEGPNGPISNADLSPTGSNLLKVIARNTEGWLFVNDQFVANLYLNDNLDFGDIGVVTGLFRGNEITGEATAYTNFTVWQLP